MKAGRRRIAVAVIGGLTTVSALGCHWQLQRYRQSSFRWNRIEEQLRRFEPARLPDASSLRRDNTAEWEYLLVTVRGRFLPHARAVLRAADGRLGYFLLQLFETVDGRRLFVNRGWIPREMREAPEVAAPAGEVELSGILKKNESWEVKEAHRRALQRAAEEHLIDLERLGAETAGAHAEAYLERMVANGQPIQPLYPFPATAERYARPYLTPRRHLEYACFWATCAGFGLLYALKLLRGA